MSSELLHQLASSPDGTVVFAEVALELGIEADGLEQPFETIEISVDEAARAIRGFANAAAVKPEIARHILGLLEKTYEDQVAFLLADNWTFVESVGSKGGPPGKKCHKECMQVCQPVCKKVCRKRCRSLPGTSDLFAGEWGWWECCIRGRGR